MTGFCERDKVMAEWVGGGEGEGEGEGDLLGFLMVILLYFCL